MADFTQKSKSPFFPGQPVPVELFAGRKEQIEHIMTRGAGQVAHGKPTAIFIQGEYGIGKSSIANFIQRRAEMEQGLHGIYASLGGCRTLNDVAQSILEATVQSGAFHPDRSQKIKDWLAKYISDQEIFGVKLNLENLKNDAPSFSTHSGLLSFLSETHSRLKESGIKGITLVLDEINGIAYDPLFANFIKGIVDTNALSKSPLPLLLVVCGVEEKRRELIKAHQPIDRIFDVVEIPAMNEAEMGAFFQKAFSEVKITVEPNALSALTQYSAGFPKMMHLIGDAAYWKDNDGIISFDDAAEAVMTAAEEVGKKYVDQQIYKALRTEEYHSLLHKIAQAALLSTDDGFIKEEVAAMLTADEKKRFNNFLQRMKKLKVLRSGDIDGQYFFNSRMVWFYIYLQSKRRKRAN